MRITFFLIFYFIFFPNIVNSNTYAIKVKEYGMADMTIKVKEYGMADETWKIKGSCSSATSYSTIKVKEYGMADMTIKVKSYGIADRDICIKNPDNLPDWFLEMLN